MSYEIAIQVDALSKCYQIYETPRDRLKQFILPKMQGVLGVQPKRYFNEFWALKDISFEVKMGETVGIVGRNGSGKSTLLQMICGTLNPTLGSIKTNGRIAALLELGSGFNPEFTGAENVYMNAAILGLSNKEIKDRLQEIIEFADIGDFIHQPIKHYSSGMIVRLAFAVAVSVEPNILIIDEALSVGDELFQRKCFSRISSLRQKGVTILFVSHSAVQIVELCDRAILIDGGELICQGEPKKIIGKYQKLIYSPVDAKEMIRSEMIDNEFNEEDAEIGFSKQLSYNAAEIKSIEFFDPNLKPKSTIAFESLGAVINNPKIFSLDGRQVNNLVRGATYRFIYNVNFNHASMNVRFGMLIKSIAGLEIAGAVSAPDPSRAITHVESNTSIGVEFIFTCLLNPGIYFLNAGVLGEKDGVDIFLHRILDLAVFRVLPLDSNTSTSLVHFNFQSLIHYGTI